MNKKIKFRFWDPVNKTFRRDYYVKDSCSYDHFCEPQNNLIIQQFTGLLDKNGVEIYEGDKVQVFYTYECEMPYGSTASEERKLTGVVEYDFKRACYVIRHKRSKFDFSEFILSETVVIQNEQRN